MGMSTDAILAFGFDIGEVGSESVSDFFGQDMDERDINDVAEEIELNAPIEFVWHCHYEMCVVALRSTVTIAYCGTPKTVTTRTISDEEIEVAKKYIEGRGWKWQEPKWLLFSKWSC